MSSKHQHMGEKAEVGNCSILQQQHVPSPQQSLWCTGWVVCMSAARLWSRSSWSCHIKKVGLPPSFLDWLVPQSGLLCHFCAATLTCCPPLQGLFQLLQSCERNPCFQLLYILYLFKRKTKQNKTQKKPKKNTKKHQNHAFGMDRGKSTALSGAG